MSNDIAIYDVKQRRYVSLDTSTTGLRSYISFERLIEQFRRAGELNFDETIDQFVITSQGGLNYRIKDKDVG